MMVRKTILTREVVTADETGRGCTPITRVAGLAVLENPFAGTDQQDLGLLFEAGAELGERLAREIVALLPAPPVGYGKAAIVGALGAMEHGAALIHPKLGRPVRAAVGGGQALMPSNVKVAGIGVPIDLPLGHKDDPWSFDHIDTMSLLVPDAPRADELVLCIAVSDGTRPHARVGPRPAPA